MIQYYIPSDVITTLRLVTVCHCADYYSITDYVPCAAHSISVAYIQLEICTSYSPHPSPGLLIKLLLIVQEALRWAETGFMYYYLEILQSLCVSQPGIHKSIENRSSI